MDIVVRDFNTPTNHLGEIVLYLSNNNKIGVTILNLHEHVNNSFGQVWMYVKYNPNIDIYDTFMNILNKLTRDIFQEMLEVGRLDGDFDMNDTVESITFPYKDVVPIKGDDNPTSEPVHYSGDWENYILFTRECVEFLEEIECDMDDEDKHIGLYIIRGEILENGEFIYDKPIRSNSYKG